MRFLNISIFTFYRWINILFSLHKREKYISDYFYNKDVLLDISRLDIDIVFIGGKRSYDDMANNSDDKNSDDEYSDKTPTN